MSSRMPLLKAAPETVNYPHCIERAGTHTADQTSPFLFLSSTHKEDGSLTVLSLLPFPWPIKINPLHPFPYSAPNALPTIHKPNHAPSIQPHRPINRRPNLKPHPLEGRTPHHPSRNWHSPGLQALAARPIPGLPSWSLLLPGELRHRRLRL